MKFEQSGNTYMKILPKNDVDIELKKVKHIFHLNLMILIVSTN
jgi:hypothetical protein